MGWNFRKSFKVLPGVRVNIGKKGVSSASVGGKWLRTNLSGRGVNNSASVPGTGVSYRTGSNAAGINPVFLAIGILAVAGLVVFVIFIAIVIGLSLMKTSNVNDSAPLKSTAVSTTPVPSPTADKAKRRR